MRVLWSVNTILPDISQKLNLRMGHALSWIDAMRSSFVNMQDTIQLCIVCHGGYRVRRLTKYNYNGILYYILPHSCEKKDMWHIILQEFKPDIIHIYGTERKHNLSLVENYKDKYPIIISLQGIISEYSRHYFAMLSFKEIILSYTIHDLVFRNGIIEGRRSFIKQSKIENKMLKEVSYVEGRSQWDKETVYTINPNLMYYHCPRMIRSAFFSYSWNLYNCKRHSILVSQGDYPIKGLHFLLDALVILKDKYPDIKLYIAGKDIFQTKWYFQKGYSKFIKNKIKSNNLYDYIEFLGFIDANMMAKKLSEVNVCIVPSAIENAPNSISEAMIVGTPIVASYVGGNAEMLNNGSCGMLYCYYEPQMLASKISELFENDKVCLSFSNEAKIIANKRHDPNIIQNTLIYIYSDVIKNFNR